MESSAFSILPMALTYPIQQDLEKAQRRHNKELVNPEKVWIMCSHSREPTHKFPLLRWHYHLMQCDARARNKLTKKLAVEECTENGKHIILAGTIEKHWHFCPDFQRRTAHLSKRTDWASRVGAPLQMKVKRNAESIGQDQDVEMDFENQPQSGHYHKRRQGPSFTMPCGPGCASFNQPQVYFGLPEEENTVGVVGQLSEEERPGLQLQTRCRCCSHTVSFEAFFCPLCYLINPQLLSENTKHLVPEVSSCQFEEALQSAKLSISPQ